MGNNNKKKKCHNLNLLMLTEASTFLLRWAPPPPPTVNQAHTVMSSLPTKEFKSTESLLFKQTSWEQVGTKGETNPESIEREYQFSYIIRLL
jgi:hypothetical protein